MTGEAVEVQRESFWKQHQNTLVQVRQDLLSGKRSRSNLSPAGSIAPVTHNATVTRKSKHPPFGKYRRTPSPYLPKLSPVAGSGKPLQPSPSKLDVLPPVKPKLAFVRNVADYDSWGEESNDEEEDYADDSSIQTENRRMPAGAHTRPRHRGKPLKQYKPKSQPQTPAPSHPVVVYGAPFPVYYPPPPRHSRSRRVQQIKQPDRGRKPQPRQTVTSSRIPVSKKRRRRRQMAPADTAPAVAVMYPATLEEDEEEESEEGDESAKSALLYIKQHPMFASDFTDWFIQDCLHTELLPDFLIETFTEIRHMPYNHPLYVPSLYCCEDIVADHVSEMITNIVHETVTEMAYDYIDDKRLQRDPVEDYLCTLTEDVVTTGIREIVRSSVVELAEQYMTSQFATGIVHGLVDEYLGEIGPHLLEDLQFDLAAEAFIMSEVIGPEVAEEAQVVAGEVIQNYDSKVIRRQLREVKHLAELKLADVLMMELIFSVMSQQGQLWSEDDHLSRHLDGMIFNESFHQIFTINKERSKTLYCKPLHKLHEKAVSDVALDVFLQQLSRSLDEDLADVDEYERGVTLPVIMR
ncbi:hypothetical protein BsWGS_17059 [Bradybaena similaris]